MSKQMEVLSKITTVLGKLQDRLSKVALQTVKNTGELAALSEETRLKTNRLAERAAGLQTEADRAWTLNASRAEVVKKLSADTTSSLNQLKDSTQRGFDGVRLDMENALRALQSMNARCAELESRILQLEAEKKAHTIDVERFEKVLAVLREAFGE